jgi:SAM-dependent methyltransferase
MSLQPTRPSTTAHTAARGAVQTARCPSCGAEGLREIYSVDDVPVHSVLLMPTREKAVSYPRGDLRLGYCAGCGFLANTVFDAGVHEYSPEYEETQGFSPSFNAFADALAKDMIARYGVRDRVVLEIGCGKGEFLERMCRFGNNRGIGIDPSVVPERTSPDVADRIRFVQDFYSEKFRDLHADFVCCRHTLEHIAPVGDFVRGLRETIGDRATTVFFELPETLRVLAEGAFWDVYYEHCSYFTPGSLARLFRRSGFDVVDLELGFGDQYILLVARPAAGPTTARLPLEHDEEELAALVERYATEGPASVARWRRRVEELSSGGRRLAVWGAGSKAVAFLTTLGITEASGRISALVDINPFKQGKFLPGTGHQVVGPERLAEVRPDHVIVMNPIYCDEIRRDLERMGLAPELVPV